MGSGIIISGLLEISKIENFKDGIVVCKGDLIIHKEIGEIIFQSMMSPDGVNLWVIPWDKEEDLIVRF